MVNKGTMEKLPFWRRLWIVGFVMWVILSPIIAIEQKTGFIRGTVVFILGIILLTGFHLIMDKCTKQNE